MYAFPVMEAGGAGAEPATMARVCAMEVPQLELPITEMVPAVVLGVTIIEFVAGGAAGTEVQPLGRVQAYVVPGTLVTVYVLASPGQNVEEPLMTPGCGAPTGTRKAGLYEFRLEKEQFTPIRK